MYLDVVSLIEDDTVELDLVDHTQLLVDAAFTLEALLLLPVHRLKTVI